MPSIFSIFSSKKAHKAVDEQPAIVRQGDLKVENTRDGFVKVTSLQTGQDFFRGDSAYEAEVAKARELSQLRELNRVRLITAKFEEIIASTSPDFLSTPIKYQNPSQIEAAEKAMRKAQEYAERIVELEILDTATQMIRNPKALQGLKRIQSFAKGLKAKKELAKLKKRNEELKDRSATIIQRNVRRVQAYRKAKAQLDGLKRRAERQKLLVSTMPHVKGLIGAGVLEQNEHTGKVKLGSNPDARYQEEFEAYDPADTFVNPLAHEDADPVASEYQAKYTLKERVAHADRLMSSRPERKTLDQMIEEAKVKKAKRQAAPRRKRMTRQERVQALISGNSFFSEMREPLEISFRGERYTVQPTKPSVVLEAEFNAAFADLDAEA